MHMSDWIVEYQRLTVTLLPIFSYSDGNASWVVLHHSRTEYSYNLYSFRIEFKHLGGEVH